MKWFVEIPSIFVGKVCVPEVHLFLLVSSWVGHNDLLESMLEQLSFPTSLDLLLGAVDAF